MIKFATPVSVVRTSRPKSKTFDLHHFLGLGARFWAIASRAKSVPFPPLAHTYLVPLNDYNFLILPQSVVCLLGQKNKINMVNKVTKRGRKREMEAGVKKSKLIKPDEFEVAKLPKNKKNKCPFDSLLQRNVPHIIEMIFLSLDYDSFKECLDVNATWRNQISSAFLRRNGELLCYKGIFEDERKLLKAADLGLDCHVKIFLDYGMIDVNASDHIGNTSLHFAVRNGDKKVVNILLDRGAKPDIYRLDGEQPLHIAASKGEADLVKIFLDG